MTDFIEAIAPLRSPPGAGTAATQACKEVVHFNVDACPHVGV